MSPKQAVSVHFCLFMSAKTTWRASRFPWMSAMMAYFILPGHPLISVLPLLSPAFGVQQAAGDGRLIFGWRFVARAGRWDAFSSRQGRGLSRLGHWHLLL